MREALNDPVTGQGGFQTLIRRLRAAVKPEGKLTVSEEDIDLIRRYRNEYGGGGWQDRLDRIFGRTLGPFD